MACDTSTHVPGEKDCRFHASKNHAKRSRPGREASCSRSDRFTREKGLDSRYAHTYTHARILHTHTRTQKHTHTHTDLHVNTKNRARIDGKKARIAARFEAAMYQPIRHISGRWKISNCTSGVGSVFLTACFHSGRGEKRTFSKFDTILIEFAFYPIKVPLKPLVILLANGRLRHDTKDITYTRSLRRRINR